MKEILIVLGSPNSSKGELLDIAIDRLNYCLNMFDKRKNLILCTGGFGKHFNTTETPHAKYAINYLMKCGIDERYFLEMAISSNTVDDAVKTKEILSNYNFPLKIITSDYHLERAQIIFEQILVGIEKKYFGVSHTLPESIKHQFVEHERKAISGLIKNGIYF